MKKNRRQELQTNILADRLGNLIKRVGPYLKISGAVLGVGVVVLIGVLWQRAGSRARSAAVWEEFLSISVEAELAKVSGSESLGSGTRLQREVTAYATVAIELEALADENENAPAAGWIRAAAGDALLSAGMRQLYTDHGEARQNFRRAAAIYKDLLLKLVDQGDVGSDLYDRVRYGSAQALEGLSFVPSKSEATDQGSARKSHDKNIKEAQRIYRDLAENSKSSGVKRMAEYRLRILSPIAGKAWEDGDALPGPDDWASWLAQQELPDEPQPIVPSPHGGLPPGGGGAFNPGGLPAGLAPGPTVTPALSEEPTGDPAAESTEDKPPANPPSEATKEDDPKPAAVKDDAKSPGPASPKK